MDKTIEYREAEMISELLGDGYSKESIIFSFTPRFIHASNGWYYSKSIPLFDSEEKIEVGVLINPKYDSMEVYICECVVGCCGVNMGVHQFGLEKIRVLVGKYLIDYK